MKTPRAFRSWLAVLTMVFCGAAIVGAGPVFSRGKARPASANAAPKAGVRLDPADFRCIVVGDSQTTGPNSERIRTQFHRWDASFVGEQLVVGNHSAGFAVNVSNGASNQITYRSRDVDVGWGDGGPNDFFAIMAHEWEVAGDLNIPYNRFGRFLLRFDSRNTDAPWDEAWGVGVPLRAYIAVRTGPMAVPAVQVRAERGGVASNLTSTVHELSRAWGVQIIEQDIPVGINPTGDDVGIGLYFPQGYEEKPGQKLQVLGVVIERVAPDGSRERGVSIGYQGRGGWTVQDHIDRMTQASRVAMVEMIDAEYVLIMLGHNQEDAGALSLESRLGTLVGLYEDAFKALGRPRPTFVYVVPWTIISVNTGDYLLETQRVMRARGAMNRRDLCVDFLPLHDYTRPDVFDPDHYRLDPTVHPADVPTAVNLAQDLYEMLFEGRRE